MLSADTPDINNWVENTPRPPFISVLDELSVYENKTILTEIAETYLELHPVPVNAAEPKSSEDLMEKIILYKDYAAIAHFAGNTALALENSTYAFQLSEKLNQGLESLRNHISKNLASASSAPELSGVYFQNDPENPAGKALQVQTLLASDEESARRIAKDLYLEIKTKGNVHEILANNQAGRLLSPLQLINLFLETGLIREAADVAEKLIEIQPMNAELIKQSAEMAYQYGAYRKACDHYNRLEVCRELIREEKVHLAEALEKLANWQGALGVWKKINPVSLEDFQRIAICCYKAGDENYFKEVVKAAANFYRSAGLFQVLDALFQLKAGHEQEAQALFSGALNSQKRDVYSIQYLIDFMVSSGQYALAKEYIASLSSIEADLPEILVKRYEIARRLTNDETCHAVLAKAAELGTIHEIGALERLLDFCSSEHETEIAEALLAENEKYWPLSPHIQAYKARALIEKGNYSKGRAILEGLIGREQPEEIWLMYYGLAVLERKLDSFPLAGISTKQPQNRTGNVMNGEVFQQFPDNLILKIMQAEFNAKDRLARYQAILAEKDIHLNPDLWRVYAGLGNYYFQNQQYDLAIVNFREVAKAQPQNTLIHLFMIEAFSKMRLFDDALEIFRTCAKNNPLEINDIMEINVSLKDAPQWMKVLEEAVAKNPLNKVLKYGLAQLYVEQNQNEKALSLIRKGIIERSSQPDDCLISAQLLIMAGLKDDAGGNLGPVPD